MSTDWSLKGNYIEEEKPRKWDKSWRIALCLRAGWRCGSRCGTVSARRRMCVPMCPMPLGYIVLDDLREPCMLCFQIRCDTFTSICSMPCRLIWLLCSWLQSCLSFQQRAFGSTMFSVCGRVAFGVADHSLSSCHTAPEYGHDRSIWAADSLCV
jgi:hypothetical protein